MQPRVDRSGALLDDDVALGQGKRSSRRVVVPAPTLHRVQRLAGVGDPGHGKVSLTAGATRTHGALDGNSTALRVISIAFRWLNFGGVALFVHRRSRLELW